MWPFGTVSFSLIHTDGHVPINFKEVSGLKIFSLTILAGGLLVGSRDSIASDFELEFSYEPWWPKVSSVAITCRRGDDYPADRQSLIKDRVEGDALLLEAGRSEQVYETEWVFSLRYSFSISDLGCCWWIERPRLRSSARQGWAAAPGPDGMGRRLAHVHAARCQPPWKAGRVHAA